MSEYPKSIGGKLVHSAEEEKALIGEPAPAPVVEPVVEEPKKAKKSKE